MKRITLILISLAIALVATPSFAQDTIPSYKYFFVQSASVDGKSAKACWDIPGIPKKFSNGQKLQVWSMTASDSNKKDRVFRFKSVGDGYYTIVSKLNPYNSAIDVPNGNFNNNVQVQLWQKNGSDAQKFKIVHVGNGKWKISTVNGYELCLKNRSTKNGTAVVLQKVGVGTACKWVLFDASTRKAFVPKSTADNNSSNSSSEDLKTNLQDAARPKSYSTDTYFRRVGLSQFSKENTEKELSQYINEISDMTQRITVVQNIINATAYNTNSSLRYRIYAQIAKSDLAGGGFLLRVLKNKMSQNITKAANKETYSLAKNQLLKISENIKK